MKKIFAFILSIFTLSCVATTDPKNAYAQVLEGKAVMIDVREEDEIELGMIDKSLWFPLSKINNDKKWKEDFMELTNGKKIYLHCRSGVRSEKAKNLLNAVGIKSENLGGYLTLKDILLTCKRKSDSLSC